ncbi:hydrolase [Orenia metallireducens]|jgi:inner membrane protein|uniref:Hydrolase n=1 Tax=Orenia metallireducens TaxID=1413210 RepID=A0A1C0A8H4_9FIRM|nr:metal-dependent hydrolase [Orenia metallireducens]OCL26511.1 hydrolase [Orenia metallireducens]
MTYHTHSLFGFVFAVVIIKLLALFNVIDLSYLIEGSIFNGDLWKFYTAAIIGSLLPDIDHASSKAGRALWFISKPLKWFGIKHRGFTHSLLGFILFGFLTKELIDLNWISQLIWYGLLIGYVSHILADMLNVHGIPLFYPNDRKFKFHINITTGSWGEHLLFLVIFTVVTLIIAYERGYVNLNLNDLINSFS